MESKCKACGKPNGEVVVSARGETIKAYFCYGCFTDGIVWAAKSALNLKGNEIAESQHRRVSVSACEDCKKIVDPVDEATQARGIFHFKEKWYCRSCYMSPRCDACHRPEGLCECKKLVIEADEFKTITGIRGLPMNDAAKAAIGPATVKLHSSAEDHLSRPIGRYCDECGGAMEPGSEGFKKGFLHNAKCSRATERARPQATGDDNSIKIGMFVKVVDPNHAAFNQVFLIKRILRAPLFGPVSVFFCVQRPTDGESRFFRDMIEPITETQETEISNIRGLRYNDHQSFKIEAEPDNEGAALMKFFAGK